MNTNKSTRDLTERTAIAGVWTVGGKLLAKAIDLVTLMILARFLGPSQFGLIAMAMASVFVVEAVLELPLAAALIRVKQPTEGHYNTAFTLGIIRGLAIAALLFAVSIPMAQFYGEPALQSLICVLALAPALRGLMSPKMVLFSLRLDFRRDFVIDGISKLAALIVATIVAITTQSYWALAAATITTPFVILVLSYFFAPMRPSLTLAEWKVFSEIVGWNSASQFVAAINWQLDRFLLGRFVDITSFGRYSAANDLSVIPMQAIAQPVARPLMAAFSTVGSVHGLRRPYTYVSVALFAAIAPLYIYIAIMSEPIIDLVLGDKWSLAAPILRVLCLVSVLGLPIIPLGGLAMTLNQTQYMTYRSVAEFIIKFPLMLVLAASYGIEGTLWTKAIVACSVLLTSMWSVKRLIGLPLLEQTKPLLTALAALIVPTLLTVFLCRYENPDAGRLWQFGYLSVTSLAFFLTYAGMLHLVWRMTGHENSFEGMVFGKIKMIFVGLKRG